MRILLIAVGLVFSGVSLAEFKPKPIPELVIYTYDSWVAPGGMGPEIFPIFEKKLASMAMPFPDQIIHDWWLAFVASMNGRIAFVNEPLVKYRQHSSSVIGAVKLNGRAKEEIDKQKIIRERIRYFLEACGNSDSETKNVLTALQKSYSGFSLANNFSRMFTFFKYQKKLLATKKRSRFRKWLFCIKMFFIII